MAVRFVNLHIAGFKSFAEPVHIDILPGLTGIVGPNGCGKSNVVEALRWVMGESSARSMRGGEMDDVIFAGTTSRAAKNFAEVSLTLEGATGLAAPPLQAEDMLCVTRRIEREAGSDYRINSRSARARDVQTLFADMGSGARSSGMVSQGRVANLINARPEERRTIIEEAAGITGLHNRKHEAALKLRAAESNLERVEDLRQQLAEQLDSLRAQSEQAKAYRRLASEIRETEETLVAVLHNRAQASVTQTHETLVKSRENLSRAQQKADEAIVAEESARTLLPTLQKQLDQQLSTLERQKAVMESFTHDEKQLQAALNLAKERVDQHEKDLSAAQKRLEDAEHTLKREQAALAGALERGSALPQEIKQAEAALAAHHSEVAATAQSVEDLAQKLANLRPQHDHNLKNRRALTEKHAQLTSQHQALLTEREQIKTALPPPATGEQLRQNIEHNKQELANTESELARLVAEKNEAAIVATRAEHEALNAQRAFVQQTGIIKDIAQRLEQLEKDINGLHRQREEAQALVLSEEEKNSLTTALATAQAKVQTLRQSLSDTQASRSTASTDRLEAQGQLQEVSVRFNNAQKIASQQREQKERLSRQRDSLLQRHKASESALITVQACHEAQQARQKAEEALHTLMHEQSSLEEQREHSAQKVTKARQELEQLELEHTRLETSANALRQIISSSHEELEGHKTSGWPVIADELVIPPGLERAVAAALGEDVLASSAPEAPNFWREIKGECPALPPDAQRLSDVMRAPAALARRLSFTGLIDPKQHDPRALQLQLLPGQMLVSPQGHLWRWDGFCATAQESADRASLELQQRNHLRELDTKIAGISAILPRHQEALEKAQREHRTLEEKCALVKKALKQAEAQLKECQKSEAELKQKSVIARTQHDAIEAQLKQLTEALEDTIQACTAAEEELKSLPELEGLRSALAEKAHTEEKLREQEKKLEAELLSAESALEETRSAYDKKLSRNDHARQRISHIVQQLEALSAQHNENLARRDAEEAKRQNLLAPEKACSIHQECEKNLLTLTQKITQLEKLKECQVEDLRRLSKKQAKLREETAQHQNRLQSLTLRLESLSQDIKATEDALAANEMEASALPPQEPLEKQLQAERNILATLRKEEQKAQAQLTALLNEHEATSARIPRIKSALEEWQQRHAAAKAECDNLNERLTLLKSEHATLAEKPAFLARQRAQHEAALQKAQADYDTCVRKRAEAEVMLAETARNWREAEARLSTAREALAKAESRHEQAVANLEQFLTEHPAPPAIAAEQLAGKNESALRHKLNQMLRRREEIGPVNLLADAELQEKEAQNAAILNECHEINTAITHLNQSIDRLNREGRERLSATFEQVNRHFQTLFTRMFSGGSAHLSMIGSSDPLEAGLEIYVRPPGKKLATLSLLSGGEQALTALSLIFAIFLCNPAPICVLDEVDAPLDDTNVERFCTLLADMVHQAGTRFLVVTHHQLTMSHMDRLYGVTMQERGVSRILSVDFARAAEMVSEAGRA